MGNPVWYLAVHLIVLVIVGAGAAVVAFMQWRTSHQKVNLDLFDRRLAIVSKARDAMGAVIGRGRAGDESVRAFHLAIIDSEFLFGAEVQELLRTTVGKLTTLNYIGTVLDTEQLSQAQRAAHLRERREILAYSFDFYGELATRVLPYMKQHSKVVPLPAEYFRELNRQRRLIAE